MKDGVKQILGKTISAVVVAESADLSHVFLVFSDDTNFEFYGGRAARLRGLRVPVE